MLNEKRGSGKNLLPVFFAVFLIMVIICLSGTIFLYHRQNQTPKITLDLSTLDSPYAVLLDAGSGAIIGEKNSDDIIFPASMVKIMTAYAAIDEIKDLDQTVTMSASYYDFLYRANASRAGFEPGETATPRQLLYGAILPSGAECCQQLALTAAGSEISFVQMMNQKANKLGLENTHFTNCTGLHNDDQYSTVREIAQLLRAALKNRTFSEVFTAKNYTVSATDIHPDGFSFESSMFKALSSPTVTGGEILGGKTGYTGEAGHCLASLAEINGNKYILVTAGWASNPQFENYHISDAVAAYNQLGQALL